MCTEKRPLDISHGNCSWMYHLPYACWANLLQADFMSTTHQSSVRQSSHTVIPHSSLHSHSTSSAFACTSQCCLLLTKDPNNQSLLSCRSPGELMTPPGDSRRQANQECYMAKPIKLKLSEGTVITPFTISRKAAWIFKKEAVSEQLAFCPPWPR